MTSPERLQSVCEAIRYVTANRISGAFVECGVWRGGSSMAAALTLIELGETRNLYLFDTFEGMVPPGDYDWALDGCSAHEILKGASRDSVLWGIASLENVRQNMAATGYPIQRITFVPGRVEETIPASAPAEIAVLRLDTDWYESTRHELEHLYPRLAASGVMIVDDYGHWKGAARAVDEFFGDQRPFLHRIDYTGRLIIKPQTTSG
jgi:O-methyltransferase